MGMAIIRKTGQELFEEWWKQDGWHPDVGAAKFVARRAFEAGRASAQPEEEVEPELKPCPYPSCRGRGYFPVPETSMSETSSWWVECEQCSASGPAAETRALAISAWNEAPRG